MTNQKITQRELHVIKETLKGKSTSEIANSLFITNHTVKAHLKSIFCKTGTFRRIELICELFSVVLETNLTNKQLMDALNILIMRNYNQQK